MHVYCLLVASEELTMGGMRFTTFDLGGHKQGQYNDTVVEHGGGLAKIDQFAPHNI